MHIAIIGSGSAAFAAAIRATESGARVTLIERDPIIGGTCVNVGCVPSKIALRAAGIQHLRSHQPFAAIALSHDAVDSAALFAQLRVRVDELRQNKYQHILDDNPGDWAAARRSALARRPRT